MKWIWRGLWLAIVTGFFIVAAPSAQPDVSQSGFQALSIARDNLFDFVEWEAQALLDKGTNAVVSPQAYMTDEERVAYVREYLDLVSEIQRLEREITAIYVDPAIDDPDTASTDLQTERDRLRATQQERQALAEAIIQSQISEMLVEYGFGVGGTVYPPVAMRFTQLPTILITSPRDRIERTGSFALDHGITVDEMETIEQSVKADLDKAALVVPIGGLAVYPSMIIETGYLPFVYEVGAHEWLHHYLAFFPLGFNYGGSPELYTMNETTASIFGKEIGWAVLDRYYPDLAPPPPDYVPRPPDSEAAPPEPAAPPAFDFRVEMRETRLRVDELLEAGQIEEAEAYMEERREVFVENGYAIRKLNQAYFAFYGSYADEPGATGSDPVGPAVREMRYYSDSLEDFIITMQRITTFEELQAELEEARADATR